MLTKNAAAFFFTILPKLFQERYIVKNYPQKKVSIEVPLHFISSLIFGVEVVEVKWTDL